MSTIKSSAEHLTLNADGALKDIILQNNGSTKVTVKSDGNVGVGTNSPTNLVNYASVSVNGSSGSMIETMVGGTRTANIQSSSTETHIQTRTNTPIIFDTNSTEKLRIQSGGGISFNGDTAAANALDDYEEGTFLPTIGGSLTAGTPTYDDRHGRYTKVGRLVTYQLYVVWSGLSGAAGTLRVGGLPFTSASSTYNAVSIYLDRPLTMSTNHILQGYVPISNTVITLSSYSAGGATIEAIAIDTNSAFMIQGSYIV